jgi:hypothetical protein
MNNIACEGCTGVDRLLVALWVIRAVACETAGRETLIRKLRKRTVFMRPAVICEIITAMKAIA